MDKNKLLEAIQKDNKGLDEREHFIKKSSYGWGHFMGLLLILLLMIIRLVSGEMFSQDLLMIVMGQLSFISLYEYTKNKENKSNLYIAIFGFLITLGCLYNTLVYYEIV